LIRRATAADLTVCLEMGRRFHAASGLDMIPFDEVSALNTLSRLMDASGLLVVEESGTVVGMAGVFAAASYWNSKVKTAGVLFIWIEPKQRGGGTELLQAIEEWARENDAAVLVAACLEAIKASSMMKWYERNGYTCLEHCFWKAMT